MIEVSDSAAEMLSTYLRMRNIALPLRVAPMEGCEGLSLGLTVDEQKEGDLSLQKDSVTYIIDPELSKTLGKVKVDYEKVEGGAGCGGGTGFSVTSENPLPNAGGSCGESCSTGCGESCPPDCHS